jgi:hypothetical protein
MVIAVFSDSFLRMTLVCILGPKMGVFSHHILMSLVITLIDVVLKAVALVLG